MEQLTRTSGEYYMAHYSLTPRVHVLAERLLSQKSTLCTEHAATLNALDGDIAGIPAAVKPARRFYELMRQLPLCISPDELIVGDQTRKPHGAIFHDESAAQRPSAFRFLNLSSDLDSPDYRLIVEKGVLAIKHQLEEKTRSLGSAVSRSGMDEVNGCRAAIYACDALLALAQNLATSAETLAAAESNPYRQAELLESAAILHHVPAHPARNFKEACQAFYLFQLALQLDNGSYAVNPEGADKALLPWYQRDIANGTLTPQRAYEIVECLWFKLAQLSEVRAACAIDGYPMFDALRHGASLDDPSTIINELSALFLCAQRNLSALNLPVRLFHGEQKVSAAPFAACSETTTAEGLTPRMQRLRNHYLTVRPSVSIYRALAFTEVVKANPGMPTILLRAKAFRHACETAPILIQDDELIVGHPCGKPRAGAFSPDIAWRWVRDELDTMSTRPQDPFEISEEDKKTIREEIVPFWEGRSLDEICEAQYREAGVWAFSGETFVSDLSYHQINGGGDTCPGYDVLLFTKGMNGIKADAEAHLASLSMENPEDIDRIYYYKAAIETCEGVINYAHRIAARARELAAIEQNAQRRAELLTIAEVNQNVPANPPKTLQEALQSIWTVESLFEIEENQTGLSLGRVDQYCYPMFEADIREGRLTHEARWSCCRRLSSNAPS
jgi:formate C-acetyltransferase